MNIKPCFGIISYFPWTQPERKQRQNRLDALIKQLSQLWPQIPIIVIAQQWKLYTWENKCVNPVFRYDYPVLGILSARQELRKRFLESDFDYLIMLDDDAIIQYDNNTATADYIKELDNHPNGFCFIKGNGSSPHTAYNDSQLNLCAVSRYIYEKEPIPNVNPQKSEGFEDRVWSTLLHYKYADLEFDAPSTIRSVHFKNPNIAEYGGEVPSTWSKAQKYNWKYMRTRTVKIEDYISQHKTLPDLRYFYSKDFFDHELEIVEFNKKYHFMQLWGDCSGLGYLGDIRNRGPIDNVYSVLPQNIELLLNNEYYNYITTSTPQEYPRRPSFVGDTGRTYDYKTVKIIHNNPLTVEYQKQLLRRIEAFNEFYKQLKENKNYYFTINLNNEIVNPATNTFISEEKLLEIIKILKEYNILDKTIFVGLKQKIRKDTSNMYIKNINFSRVYGVKYIEIEDNDVWNTTKTHLQFITKVSKVI